MNPIEEARLLRVKAQHLRYLLKKATEELCLQRQKAERALAEIKQEKEISDSVNLSKTKPS